MLCGRGYRHFHHGAMPLGVRTFFGGTARYRTERGTYAVDEGTWFVVNDAQPYTISFDSKTLIRSCVAFFPDGWAADVAHNLSSGSAALLDNPETSESSVHFFETVAGPDADVLPRLRALHARCERGRVDDRWLEERLRDLLAAVVQSQHQHRHEAADLPALRATTRNELYRRLLRGRDFLRATAEQAPTLAEAARVACLSPFHFQRSFRAAFRETPHGFVTGCRLDRARRLITHSTLPITAIALEVGYASFGAFSRAFRLRFGAPPSRFRKN
jgi:AraC-like DNA-binding protein